MMPPNVGPVLTPSATTTALRPSARPRSLPGNAVVSIAGLMDISNAPPNPCKARAAIKKPSVGAAPQIAEPPVKMTSPATQIGLRPIMSARRPTDNNTAAVTTRYAIMTHSTAPLSGTPNELAIVGKLILTIDESSVAINTPTATIASTDHFPAVSPNVDRKS